MTRWVLKEFPPPECVEVLLYVVARKRKDDEVWTPYVFIGFYSSENKNWYIRSLSGLDVLEDKNHIKVLSWTLLPELPNTSFFDNSAEVVIDATAILRWERLGACVKPNNDPMI